MWPFWTSIVEHIRSIAAVLQQLLQAWHHWATEAPEATKLLFGHPMYYWSRVGKIFELGALVVIIVDLIGPDRLRHVGSRLNTYEAGAIIKWFGEKLSVPIFIVCLAGYTVFIVYALATAIIESPPGWPEFQPPPNWSETPLIGKIMIGVIGILFGVPLVLAILFGLFVIPLVVMVTAIALLFTMMIALYVALAVRVLEPLVRVAAWALEKPSVSVWAKIVSVVLFLVGFHFDLLTS